MHEPIFRTLNNGMRLALWPQPHLHSLGIGLYVQVGSRFEATHHMGISHFLEHVLFRGNATYPSSLEMNRAFESWGGSINAYTTREYTYFYGKLHPDYAQEGVSFMADLVHQPLFEKIDVERQIILEERLEDVDSDGQLLEEDDISRDVLWKGHPLSFPIIGTPKSIRRIREHDIKEHFERFYGTQNFVLCVTGKFDPDAITEYAEQTFSALPSGHTLESNAIELPERPAQTTAFVCNDSSQISVLLSFRGPQPKAASFVSLLILDRILDDGMSSRLWQRIVEGEGLCYDLWTSIDAYSDTSVFEIGAHVAPERAIPLVEEIYSELKLLRDEGPSQEEFELAQRRWSFHHEFTLDKVDELNERLGAQILYQQYIPHNTQKESIQKLTKEDVQRCAHELFVSQHHVLTAVGPLTKRLKRELKARALEL